MTVSIGEEIMNIKELSRREFLKTLGIAGIGLSFTQITGCTLKENQKGLKKNTFLEEGLVIVEGDEPKIMVKEAIEQLGGMSKCVSKGDVVVIKPNISWDRLPEQAANTNPQVVAALVELCLQAQASQVKVFDRTCNDARRCYLRSGIAAAARKAGAKVSFVDERRFRKIPIPKGTVLKSWYVYEEVLDADVLINVPIAKHHTLSKLTLGMKNLMGIIGGNRGIWHQDIHHYIAEFNSAINVHLTVLDAIKILTAHGPQGGRVEDVKFVGQIIASTDRVAVDAYATTLFDLNPEDIGYIKYAHQLGIGQINLDKVKIKRIKI
jgi:uncharacterized protein (DUF362 family)